MCKPPCCTGDVGGSALGIAIGALVVFAAITVIAPELVSIIETALTIAAIVAASLAAIALAVFTARLIIRHRRRSGTMLPLRLVRCTQVQWPAPEQRTISRAEYLAIQAARKRPVILTDKEDGTRARKELLP